MLDQQTLDKMRTMRLSAMAAAFEEQRGSTRYLELGFEERLGLLIDLEWEGREQRRLTRRLRAAKLRYKASIEDLDFASRRGLDRSVVMSLSTCQWIREHHNLLITGPAGTGKSYLACAFVERACRSDLKGYYVRTPRLLHALAVARGDGTYGRLLAKLAKIDLLAIDDWLLTPFTDIERRDLLEVLEDRSEKTSTLIATQLPIEAWHETIGEPSMGDAICDRLVPGAHRIALKGLSMREVLAKKRAAAAERKGTKS